MVAAGAEVCDAAFAASCGAGERPCRSVVHLAAKRGHPVVRTNHTVARSQGSTGRLLGCPAAVPARRAALLGDVAQSVQCGCPRVRAQRRACPDPDAVSGCEGLLRHCHIYWPAPQRRLPRIAPRSIPHTAIAITRAGAGTRTCGRLCGSAATVRWVDPSGMPCCDEVGDMAPLPSEAAPAGRRECIAERARRGPFGSLSDRSRERLARCWWERNLTDSNTLAVVAPLIGP